MRRVGASRTERGQRAARAVDVVHAPAAEPRTVGLLLGEQKRAARARSGCGRTRARSAATISSTRARHVGRARIDHRLEVAVGDAVEPRLGRCRRRTRPSRRCWHCIDSTHCDGARDRARTRVAASGWSTAASAITTTAVSSTSGYQRFSNSNAQPPGLPVRFFTAQSPYVATICLSSSQRRGANQPRVVRAARPRRRARGPRDPVSHTGEMHGCTRYASSSTIVKPSIADEAAHDDRIVRRRSRARAARASR